MSHLLADRRSFIRHFVLGSAASLTAGRLWKARVLAEILEGPVGTLVVRVSDYPALAADFGSVRITFAGAAYPVVVNRGLGDTFFGMDSDCPHQHCVVEAFSTALGHMRCCHGSQYAIDGTLLGGPSPRSLTPFETSFDGDNLVSVRIPGLGFGIRQLAVHSVSGPGMRLRLTFPTLSIATYRVEYRAELNDAPQIVSFATAPSGPANQTSLLSLGGDRTVFVDTTGIRGFYTVALVASPY
jgi:nitrite reductase/ring-hydroxylating ferredoxin subunit